MLDAYPTEWEGFHKASLALLGPGADEDVATPRLAQDFTATLASGAQPRRHYHTIEHFRDVAQAPSSPDEIGPQCSNLQEALHAKQLMAQYAWVTQVMTRAGWHHDVVYTHVDEGVHPDLEAVLQPFFEVVAGQYQLAAHPPANEEARHVYRMALAIFGFREGQVLNPYDGQNEFLSALYAGLQGLAAGLPARNILAEIAMIEATVPFRPATRTEALKARIQVANAALDDEILSDAEIEALMYGAVFMANHDVVGFRKPFEQFNRGSHLLLMEGAPTLQTPRGMYKACTRLARFLGRVGRQEEGGIASVFHSYGDFPAQATRDLWDRTAVINCEVQQERMHSYAAAALLVAAAAMVCGRAKAGETAFEHLLTDAKLEPPHHIFPHVLHEVRLQLKNDDVDSLLESIDLAQAEPFPATRAQAQKILASVPREVRVLLDRHLASASAMAHGSATR
jgi:hypothetical protein